MIEDKIRRAERIENETFSRFFQICAEEHALKMEIAIAVSDGNLVPIERIKKELEPIIAQRIQLEGEYLDAKLKGAIAVREDMYLKYGITEPDTFKLIAPTFDKYIWEAEDAFNRYREKYSLCDGSTSPRE